MKISDLRAFESSADVRERAVLHFHGLPPGTDVYNCSIPFELGTRRYLFGRVERRDEWATSLVRLFEETAPDTFALVPDGPNLPLEDPYVQRIGGEFVLGGTHVRKVRGEVDSYFGYFFRGPDPLRLRYFTTGPDKMKDIRLVGRPGGRVGVFSRPRGPEVLEKFGTEAVVGYTEIDSLDELGPDVIEAAEPVAGLFTHGEWGGVNQAYALADGRIGVAGHVAFNEGDPVSNGQIPQHYANIAFVFDPAARTVSGLRLIGTRACYDPSGEAKCPHLADVAFTSGFVPRPDGLVDLYSGIGDCLEGRIAVPAPFGS
jgi:hypothetical protein